MSIKQTLVVSLALALSCGVVHAGDKSGENRLTKQGGAGMLTGATTGAFIGGPVGAAVGAVAGSLVGDSVGKARQAQQQADLHARQLEDELAETRVALAQASERAAVNRCWRVWRPGCMPTSCSVPTASTWRRRS